MRTLPVILSLKISTTSLTADGSTLTHLTMSMSSTLPRMAMRMPGSPHSHGLGCKSIRSRLSCLSQDLFLFLLPTQLLYMRLQLCEITNCPVDRYDPLDFQLETLDVGQQVGRVFLRTAWVRRKGVGFDNQLLHG